MAQQRKGTRRPRKTGGEETGGAAPPGWNAAASGGSHGAGGGWRRGGYDQGYGWNSEQDGFIHEGSYVRPDSGRRPGREISRQGGWRGRGGAPESWVGEVVRPYERMYENPYGTRPQGWRSEDDYTLGTDRQMGHGRTRGPYTGLGPRGYVRSDDRIREDVCDRLTEHGGIDATHITVQVADGEVTLEGEVEERAQKFMAEEVADTVVGVQEVHNRLRLRGRGRERPTQG